MKKEKFGKVKKTGRKIGILIDSIKGLIIVLVVFTLIVFFASAIVHNILRFGEVSSKYTGEYKNLYSAGKDDMMNIYTVGENERTILIFPTVGDYSPVIKYKSLADSLSAYYRVTIVEPLGYGYSLSTKEERTNENIVNEIRNGLSFAEVHGPYTIIAFGTSSIYADYYCKIHPEEISGLITINGMYPESVNSDDFKDSYLPNLKTNVKFYSIISYSGMFRWESYLNQSKFHIDEMKNNESYDEDAIKVYRNAIANKFMTKCMRKEIYKLEDNMTELVNYQYYDNLPTLQIITTNYRDEMIDRGENIINYSVNLMSNKDIQHIRTIEGDIDDYLFDSENVKIIRNMISYYF